MKDYLKSYSVDQVAAWYLRLADAADKLVSSELKNPLAGVFLRTWVNNRTTDAKIEFDAPAHLRKTLNNCPSQARRPELWG
jgi:hypothetical protein